MVTGGVKLTATGGDVAGTEGISAGLYDWGASTISVTNHSLIKLYGGNANKSRGYSINQSYGNLNISNGGQILAVGNTSAVYGKIHGASQASTGQMVDGSDATTIDISNLLLINYKYVLAIN